METTPLPDPTYDSVAIEANPVWSRAFLLSERENDSAPIGWSRYIGRAQKELEAETQAQAAQDADVAPVPDPTLTALSSRARDLSLAIANPATLARKLRESLIDLVGPEQSRAYHIGASYDSETGEVQVQIAAVSPTLLARLQASSTHGMELEVAYQRTVNGWEVAVGAKVSAAPMGEGNLLRAPDDYALGASFSVTVRR